MPVEIHVKIVENTTDDQMEFDFIPYQVGHMTPGEDQETRKFLHFFRIYTGAMQARAKRENSKVTKLNDTILQEIVKKVIKDKRFGVGNKAIEVNISDDVKEMGAAEEPDMRAGMENDALTPLDSDPNDN